MKETFDYKLFRPNLARNNNSHLYNKSKSLSSSQEHLLRLASLTNDMIIHFPS